MPTVTDRVVQTAVKRVIEPIFEREFAPSSYGFRPGRGCKDALREVERLLRGGNCHVVDVDIKGYFDNIPHEALMRLVRPKSKAKLRASLRKATRRRNTRSMDAVIAGINPVLR